MSGQSKKEIDNRYYKVDRIISCKRTKGGKCLYLIKWTGCDESENTWEPERSFRNFDLLILMHEFRAHQKVSRETKDEDEQKGKKEHKSVSNDGPVTDANPESSLFKPDFQIRGLRSTETKQPSGSTFLSPKKRSSYPVQKEEETGKKNRPAEENVFDVPSLAASYRTRV